MMMPGWSRCHVVERTQWAQGLVTMKLSSVAFPFEPGQFVNLGLDIDGTRVKRAYSLASAPDAAPEFYVSAVPGGQFSERLANLEVGSPVELETSAQGFFSLRWLPESATELWLLATGTGLGPFVSLWRSGSLFPRFERVVLVHGVREPEHFGYASELRRLQQSEPRLSYVPVLSGTADLGVDGTLTGVLRGRITHVLSSGALEARVVLPVNEARSHFMLCGNPAMVKEISEILGARGLRKHRSRAPGQITTEAYW
jgi:ferredoxin--NADP+ reductase